MWFVIYENIIEKVYNIYYSKIDRIDFWVVDWYSAPSGRGGDRREPIPTLHNSRVEKIIEIWVICMPPLRGGAVFK